MQPLVLAIEPDHRQAAIVKRIVREKVLADVTVVDSRDAALEAMRTMIPDVLLLSALLSPRDEDELIAHLRTLRDAEHLQTHTIPQLASSIGDQDVKPSKGLLSAFRRKKEPEQAPAGCDPDLFADEIRSYLKRASDKKREVRASGGSAAPMSAVMSAPAASAAARPSPAAEPAAASEPAAGSSWASPFEWRPSGATRPTPPPVVEERIPEPEPLVLDSFVQNSSSILNPEPSFLETESPILNTESSIFDPPPAGYDAEPVRYEPAYEPEPTYEPAPAYDPAPAFDPLPLSRDSYTDSYADAYAEPRAKYPLTLRSKTAKGWWFVDGKFTAVNASTVAGEPDSEMHEVLASLAVPATIAGVAYADGCRIRRVRLATA